ncbi:MAG: DUF3592 domain-containing protein [Saprospiraceae bacterium]
MRHLRQPPPRHLSIFSQLSILLGGMSGVFGWIFFLFGSIFLWVFGFNSGISNIFDPPIEEWKTAEAVIMSAKSTNNSVNERKVWEYQFQVFTGAESFSGKSYSATRRFKEGQEVQVSYLPEATEKAFIVGSERSIFPWWVAFIVALFPLIGAIFIIVNIAKNAHFLRLLINGQFTRGVMKAKKATGGSMTINDRHYPEYKYEFEFFVGSQSHLAKCRTYLAHKVEDEEEEIVLYNAANPSDSVVYDSIKNAPRINNQGQLEELPFGKMWVIGLPVLAVLEHWMFYKIMVAGNVFDF